jgi:hypothetical protein|eukprot:COSAG02_NODE_10959_length_1824_cov_7.531594_2_plen_41_part_00
MAWNRLCCDGGENEEPGDLQMQEQGSGRRRATAHAPVTGC